MTGAIRTLTGPSGFPGVSCAAARAVRPLVAVLPIPATGGVPQPGVIVVAFLTRHSGPGLPDTGCGTGQAGGERHDGDRGQFEICGKEGSCHAPAGKPASDRPAGAAVVIHRAQPVVAEPAASHHGGRGGEGDGLAVGPWEASFAVDHDDRHGLHGKEHLHGFEDTSLWVHGSNRKGFAYTRTVLGARQMPRTSNLNNFVEMAEQAEDTMRLDGADPRHVAMVHDLVSVASHMADDRRLGRLIEDYGFTPWARRQIRERVERPADLAYLRVQRQLTLPLPGSQRKHAHHP